MIQTKSVHNSATFDDILSSCRYIHGRCFCRDGNFHLGQKNKAMESRTEPMPLNGMYYVPFRHYKRVLKTATADLVVRTTRSS